PSSLIFSRQNLVHQERSKEQVANIERGGYILKDCEGLPDLILIATGSEVGLAVAAADELTKREVNVRVVSMPCTDVFDQQDIEYRLSVLPLEVPARIAIEAAIADYWYKYVGIDGRVIGMNSFGESAPAGQLFEEFGFTVDNILNVAEDLL
ncbi:transketolase C-terminal domain-containing protein, partial [Oleiphilus sp. HI0128]